MKTRYVKRSTIVIATGKRHEVYRSAAEIPDKVREKLIRCTRGENSGTIWIADRNGRAEIARAARRNSSPAEGRGEPPRLDVQLLELPTAGRAGRLPVWLVRALGLALAAGAAAVTWFSFHLRQIP